MKRRMASLLAASALFLSLCGCGGGAVDPDRYGSGGEIGASPSTGIDPSSSKTIHQPGSGTGSASGQTGTTASQTAATGTGTTRALEVLRRGNSTWKEVPIQEGKFGSTASFLGFDLRETITNSDYVFSGKVLSRKEYEVSWTSEKGNLWGPYKSSIIEVEVTQEYYGQSPVEGNIIKVYYPYSLSVDFDNSVLIKDQGEYVFVTGALDEEFVQRKKKESPDDQYEQEKYADVYLGNPVNRLFPIEEGNVLAFRGYFNWNDEVMKKVKPDMETDKISYGRADPWFLVLSKQDFDSAFSQLFENPETLPTAKDIFSSDETTTGQTEATTGQTMATATHPATGQAAAATGAGTTTCTPGELTTATDEGVNERGKAHEHFINSLP